MKTLQAVLFGIETLIDRRDVERRAYNRVFGEAALPWTWDAAEYTRLCRLSRGGDVLDAFIRTERPHWRNSEDLQHLLTAVRRRHAAVCRFITAEAIEIDQDMVSVIEAIRTRAVPMCAIVPAPDVLPDAFRDIFTSSTYDGALQTLNVPAAGSISIECVTDGFKAAADAGVVSLDKLAISPSSGASRVTAILALLDDVYANRKLTTARGSRFLATVPFA